VLSQEEFRTLTNVKTHILNISYRDRACILESGQHDGSTGLFTPQIRKQTLLDADTLTRTAGLMLSTDFGIVGTVEPLADDKETCLLRLQGSNLKGIDRFLAKGDIFGFSVVLNSPIPIDPKAKVPDLKPGQVLEQPTEWKARPQASTFLRVSEIIKPGLARCEIFTGYETPFVKPQRLAGYRAMKLSTHDAPVRVAVQDDNQRSPAPTVPLEVWATEYGGLNVKPNPRDGLDAKSGIYTSRRGMRGVAYVWIKLGAERTRFVVPVLTAGQPNLLTFNFDENSVRKARFEDKVERFTNKVVDARLGQEQLYLALKQLIEKEENKKALERAEGGLKNLLAVEAELTTELKGLRANPLANDPRYVRTLNSTEQLIAGLLQGKPELEAKMNDLNLALAKADNPAEYEKKFRANEIQRSIAYHERRGEVPEALDQYDALIELTGLEEARQRKAKLAEAGKAKTPEHQAAREYIRTPWANISSQAELKEALPTFAGHCKLLLDGQDKYGVRLAVTGIQASYVKLTDWLSTLDSDLLQDREAIKAIAELRDELQKIEAELQTGKKAFDDGK
jgi:hypothetical protein